MASAAPEIPVLARDQAFETIYRRYVKDVYHYALALLRNPSDAEDVTQTTFMNAYRAYKRGDEIHKPHNWLIKIAHNVARTRYAQAGRRVKEVPLEDHVEQLAVPQDERPDVEAVLRALGRLPFNQRAALVMRELEGRSYSEIADTLEVSVPAVETLIFRARRSLRLRASALRSLAAVPLPGSLSQLFGSGGVVAGGGAAAGSGFLVKAAIALLAGAVATGIGSDRTRPAEASAKPAGPSVATSGSSASNEVAARQSQPTASATKRVNVRRRAADEGGNVVFVAPKKGLQAVVTPAPTENPTRAQEKTTTVSQAVQPVKDTVEQVNETVDSLAEPLPVEVPDVQVPTVEVPPVSVPPVPPIKLP
jgi:RNA polymerase sigma factor (sigma-70 family)